MAKKMFAKATMCIKYNIKDEKDYEISTIDFQKSSDSWVKDFVQDTDLLNILKEISVINHLLVGKHAVVFQAEITLQENEFSKENEIIVNLLKVNKLFSYPNGFDLL